MTSGRQSEGTDRIFAATTIFAGALLLFEVEPLIAKAILPWFGGSAQVWTTCLLFFQAALLAGYCYAHLLNRYAPPRWQWRIHAGLLAASLVFMPIIPADSWKPVGGEDPLWLILGLLATTIGLPFVLLSATSPLVQAWLARPVNGKVTPPYRLFALSNFGSMLALLAYPALIEPNFTVKEQAWTWSALYAGFAVLCALTARHFHTREPAAKEHAGRTPAWRGLLWFFLAAAPSGLLLALTNFMLQNVAPIPLFWIVPLALYLISFVVAYNNPDLFVPPLWYVILTVTIGVVALSIGGMFSDNGLILMPVLSAALFVFCYVSHSELALSRPEPAQLTGYYLIISAGGAAGGLFVAVIAPCLFNAPYELEILIPVALIAIVAAATMHFRDWNEESSSLWPLGAVVLVAATSVTMWAAARANTEDAIYLARNFYGALRVIETPTEASNHPMSRQLANGSILHGIELTNPARLREPTSYYAPISGVGRALTELGKDGPLHVGVIGLGVGTLAGYGRPGDVYRFYEINPDDVKIAREQFWYLSTNPARQSIVLGDGRLSLEREPAQRFDLLVVDAFTSDSIPMHLLTREAFALYWRHLKPNGVLAVHVSNRFVRLGPVVAEASAASGKTARAVDVDTDWEHGTTRSVWVLATARTELFTRPAFRDASPIPSPAGLRPWTDDYSSIWSVLRF